MAIELADKLYTSTQVADILGVSLRTLYRYMEDDKIKSMRTASGRHRFTKDHIIEFLNAGRNSFDSSGASASDNSPRNSGYSNLSRNQMENQNAHIGGYTDNIQSDQGGMPNRSSQSGEFRGDFYQQGVSRSNPYVRANNATFNSGNVAPQTDSYEPKTVQEEDDFEFDVTDYDYDKEDTTTKSSDDTRSAKFDNDFDNNDFSVSRSQNPEPGRAVDSQFGGKSTSSFSQVSNDADRGFTRSPITEEAHTAPIAPEARDIGSSLNVRYYKSDYSDLIELAKKIKDTSNSKDLEYAFTLYAGLSLHFLIRPFTVLNLYANPEDMQLWKDELRLAPSQKKEDANVGIIINTDIVFVPTKEIGGFKVVDDKVLLKDLSAAGEEDLVKQFRQHLTSL